METKTQGKTFRGTVVKTAMKDTATVSVMRYVMHPKYKKYLRKSKKYLVHDAGNTAQVGDTVVIRETKPISKRKHFMLVERISSKLEATN
ncbi:30S ribosomal protein S17 [Candidatus Kaiserbacteria bacterium RIFCSPHIGHO2_01_FULL_55_17]|uniref:Small ribosomal subunit protein uS17 n=1 Tax=Candidatus Kaiserbacteria bacterium RIFCSPHIGHO2_01_FULL_55_17 TaxID=1798484 RepID=A0A1F6D7S8_9BACT|nr:MAG: 30S ribosomal protein S17 [Candidatus Kaiserbacteria bacterium RIFCSPHIGHO2_01_FULL_55_17]